MLMDLSIFNSYKLADSCSKSTLAKRKGSKSEISAGRLCTACQSIFDNPYSIGSSERREWGQTETTFKASREQGCHLCHLLWSHLAEKNTPNQISSTSGLYAFHLLNADWARWGVGPQYVWIRTVDSAFDEWAKWRSRNAKSRPGSDFTVERLRSLLSEDSKDVLSDKVQLWAVLTFEISHFFVDLPLEVHRGDEAEQIAQLNLGDQTSTKSPETQRLAKYWLENCIADHAECRPVYDDQSWVPSRLVFVGSLKEPCLRIVQAADLDPNVKYATLSHTWGDIEHSIVTKGTLSAYLKSIPPEALSATAEDAVHVTRSLGLQYLWIDGLCILQDDKEDWHAETMQMAKVYGLSSCTIAAACSRDGNEHFLRDRNQYSVRPCKIPNPFSSNSEISFQICSRNLAQIYNDEVKRSPWHNRGWVFQERLLSQRLLIFGQNQAVWSCQKLSASETWPRGRTNEYHVDRFESFENEKLELHGLMDKERALPGKDPIWENMVQKYTSSQMTRSSDRLIALQGIASRITETTGRQYVAGLWIDDTLPDSLLWRLNRTTDLPETRLQGVPTWSWGSVTVPIVFSNDHEVLSQTYLQLAGIRERGANFKVPIANLDVRGPLINVLLRFDTAGNYPFLERSTFHIQKLSRVKKAEKGPEPVDISEELPQRQKLSTREKSILAIKTFFNQVYQALLSAARTSQRFALRVKSFLFSYVFPCLTFCLKAVGLLILMIFGAVAFIFYLLWWPISKCVGFWFGDGWEHRLLQVVLGAIKNAHVGTKRFLRTQFPKYFAPLELPEDWDNYIIKGNPLYEQLKRWNSTSRFIPVNDDPDPWKMGNLLRDIQSSRIDAQCWLDEPVIRGDGVPVSVSCLLVTKRCDIHGLILRRVEGAENEYERVGVFRSSKNEPLFSTLEETEQDLVLT